VTRVARLMVTQMGFSDRLGPVALPGPGPRASPTDRLPCLCGVNAPGTVNATELTF